MRRDERVHGCVSSDPILVVVEERGGARVARHERRHDPAYVASLCFRELTRLSRTNSRALFAGARSFATNLARNAGPRAELELGCVEFAASLFREDRGRETTDWNQNSVVARDRRSLLNEGPVSQKKKRGETISAQHGRTLAESYDAVERRIHCAQRGCDGFEALVKRRYSTPPSRSNAFHHSRGAPNVSGGKARRTRAGTDAASSAVYSCTPALFLSMLFHMGHLGNIRFAHALESSAGSSSRWKAPPGASAAVRAKFCRWCGSRAGTMLSAWASQESILLVHSVKSLLAQDSDP